MYANKVKLVDTVMSSAEVFEGIRIPNNLPSDKPAEKKNNRILNEEKETRKRTFAEIRHASVRLLPMEEDKRRTI